MNFNYLFPVFFLPVVVFVFSVNCLCYKFSFVLLKLIGSLLFYVPFKHFFFRRTEMSSTAEERGSHLQI